MFNKRNSTQSTQPKEIDYERVLGYMTWYIGRYGDRSSKSLLQKANECFREDQQFNQQAMDYLIERDIINDLRYARRLTEVMSEKNVGVNKIKQALYLKNLDAKIIEQCLAELETSAEDYFEKALILKIRKFGEHPIEEIKLKQKALRFLIAKGFDYSVANKVVAYSSD